MRRRAPRAFLPLLVVALALLIARQTLIAMPALSATRSRSASEPPAAVAAARRPVARIAYCVTRWNMTNFTESDSSPWIARTFGPFIFPPSRFKLELRECVARPSDLPDGVDPLSPEGRRGLGLDAHVRFCHKGASSLVRLLVKAGLANVSRVARSAVVNRLKHAELWRGAARHEGWHGLVYWPAHVSYLADARTGAPLPPLMFRHNFEPLHESVDGIAAQLDSKTIDVSRSSATVFYPFALFSMAFRMSDEKSKYARHIGNALGSNVTSIEQLVIRPRGFNASHERARKTGFAASVNTNCAGRSTTYPGVIVRELFSYALANVTGKPVSNIGQCPYFERGRSLLPEAARWELKKKYRDASAVEVFHDFKFALVFENSGHAGGVTEKPFTAYLGRAVPVYNGPEDLMGIANERAMINCALPANVTSYTASLAMKDAVCRALPALPLDCAALRQPEGSSRCKKEHSRAVRDRCADAYHAHVQALLWPLLVRCAERVKRVDDDDAAYETMLAQPMVPDGELRGVWNASLMGAAMQQVFVGVGYVV